MDQVLPEHEYLTGLISFQKVCKIRQLGVIHTGTKLGAASLAEKIIAGVAVAIMVTVFPIVWHALSLREAIEVALALMAASSIVFSIVIWRKATAAWKDAESIIRAKAQMQTNAPSGKVGQSTQDYEMPLIVRPASANKELLADYEFIQESMEKWRLMADAYREAIREWNVYFRDLSIPALAGRPGMRRIAIDRFNAAYESLAKRVKQFAFFFETAKKSEPIVVKTPVELASYWSRLVRVRQDSDEKFKDVENTYEYLQNFWAELTDKSDARRTWTEKNFPGLAPTPEQIDEFRKRFLAGIKVARESLDPILNLLMLEMPKLGV